MSFVLRTPIGDLRAAVAHLEAITASKTTKRLSGGGTLIVYKGRPARATPVIYESSEES
jgi:hypothetical protein